MLWICFRCICYRADELKRQYTGALCGLGFCPVTEDSLFSDHDMELVFDSLISQNDIKDVRQLYNTEYTVQSRQISNIILI